MSIVKNKKKQVAFVTVAFVTTARSDYSTMYPVMREALQDNEIAAKIFCGGMHLLEKFGETYKQLETDDIPITEKIDFFVADNTDDALTRSLSQGITAFSAALIKHKIDMIVVSGDRIENLALFSAATCLQIPICHLCGGDITEGAFDNQVRHTMTKLSHLHMVSMQEHYDRVVQMGEEPWRVHITGDAALDTVVNVTAYSRKELYEEEGIPENKDLVLCTFHPLTLGSENFHLQFHNLLNFLIEQPQTPVITYPNIDPGFDELIAALNTFIKQRPDAIIKKSFTRRGYYSMMHYADYMVGNSSSGIWEAPSFKLPCINIGSRQGGRKRSYNVIDIQGEKREDFYSALEIMQSENYRQKLQACVNPYGEGKAARKTIEVIKSTSIDDRLMIKKFFQIENPQAKGEIYG